MSINAVKIQSPHQQVNFKAQISAPDEFWSDVVGYGHQCNDPKGKVVSSLTKIFLQPGSKGQVITLSHSDGLFIAKYGSPLVSCPEQMLANGPSKSLWCNFLHMVADSFSPPMPLEQIVKKVKIR